MKHWKKNLFVVWLSQFLSIAGFSFSMPFIPYYLQTLGVEDKQQLNFFILLFTIAAQITMGIFAPLWGMLADRYGRRLMLLRANFCNAVIIILMAFAPGPWTLVGLRILMGIFTGTVTASQAMISSSVPAERRGIALGMLNSALYSGIIAGGFLGGITVDLWGYRAGFFASGSLFLVGGLLILFFARENFIAPATPEKIKWSFKLPDFGSLWLLMGIVIAVACGSQFDRAYMPLFIQQLHGSLEGAALWSGLIFGVAAGAGVLSGVLMGHLSDRFRAGRVAAVSAGIGALFFVLEGISNDLYLLMFARAGMVFFAGGTVSVVRIWLAQESPDDQRGAIFGWSATASCLGWASAALLSYATVSLLGLRWIFFCGAIFFALVMIMIWYADLALEHSDQ